VEDHCRAIDAVLHNGKIGETYCVGGMEKDWSNLKILTYIAKAMGHSLDDVLEFVPDRLGHDRKYAVDWSKIKGDLGWEPLYEVQVNLLKTIEWYDKNRWWWEK
jgi:dTDP-glucose 4,6-dehydratase